MTYLDILLISFFITTIISTTQWLRSSDNLNILVADDNAINRKPITTLLAQRGITTEAIDGKRALDAALNNNFDLIFMDIRMPELNGIEVTEVLRSRIGIKYTTNNRSHSTCATT